MTAASSLQLGFDRASRDVMTTRATPSGVPLSTMTVLMLAVFTVSVGYGVVLPLLPYLIERLLGTGSGIAAVSRSTGLLTGLYMIALFLFAPAWGRMSDRYGRRIILLIGLAGFGEIMLIFSLVESLTAVYAERLLSGVHRCRHVPWLALYVTNPRFRPVMCRGSLATALFGLTLRP